MGQTNEQIGKKVNLVTRIVTEQVLPFFSALSGFGEEKGTSKDAINAEVAKIMEKTDIQRVNTLESSLQKVNIPLKEKIVTTVKTDEKRAQQTLEEKTQKTQEVTEKEIG